MAIRNTVYDLNGSDLAAAKAAAISGVTAARAGTAAMHADEITAIQGVWAALRGRGIENPMNVLLGHYFAASGSRHYNHEVATALGATDDRAVENT